MPHNVPIWMCKAGSQFRKGGIFKVSKDGFKLQVSHFVVFLGFVGINIYKTAWSEEKKRLDMWIRSFQYKMKF